MLDHVFTDAIGALRDVLEIARLERQAIEERFQADILLGDLVWQTSYGLPGEGSPPRVQADITLEWPTWAQTAYRSWTIGEQFTESPRISIEVVLRMQRLVGQPDPALVLAVLPETSTLIGPTPLERSGVRIEIGYDSELDNCEYAIEVGYEGSYELDEPTLADAALLDEHFSAMGGWISSTLVRIGDLKFEYLPPDEEDDD
ncbi:MAG: hypothetical protein ACKVWR_20765 [Acidimicrobiales bacterium]